MADFTAVQDTPIIISLVDLAKSSGWVIDGAIASHSSCNDGNLYVIDYPLVIGQSYRLTYAVLTYSSGYVQSFLGTNGGIQASSVQFVDETIVANGTQFYFFSNGTLSIENFTIGVSAVKTNPYQQNTIAYNARQNKWVSFYSYIPDVAFSIYTKTYSFFEGAAYLHEAGSDDRCNFYGVQYASIITFTTNQQPTIVKTFQSINYQANQLLISATGGILTSLGQRSELIADDFVQQQLSPMVVEYQVEGIFQASFLRDMNFDIINGEPLKGNWLSMTMINTSPSVPMDLYSTEIIYTHSYSNTR